MAIFAFYDLIEASLILKKTFFKKANFKSFLQRPFPRY